MSHIHINYQEMRAVAGDFQRQAETTNDIIRTLNSRAEQLMAGWEGVAEQSFMGELNSCRQRMVRVPEMLNQIGSALRQTADRIEEAEREAARRTHDIITADD